MRKSIIMMAVAAAMGAGTAPAQDAPTFLAPLPAPSEAPPFAPTKPAPYLPALKAAIAEHNREIDAIVKNPEAPTFENTVLALDRAGRTYDRVANVYMALSESNMTPDLEAVGKDFEPMMTAHADEVAMNPGLFKRIKALYDTRAKLGLATAQKRPAQKLYKTRARRPLHTVQPQPAGRHQRLAARGR